MARTLRAAPSGLRIALRFLSGASRRPSSGCSGQLSTRASSRVRPPLIRSPVGYRRLEMIESRIGQFMGGFVAAAELLQRAAQNEFFVEYICLAASVIDGALRIGLILQHQLKTGSSELLEELLLQTDDDRIVSEREIYRRAAQEGVIHAGLRQKLEDLYRRRNRVVHRFIVSELTTHEVLQIAMDFEQILPAVNAAVGALEARQVELGVGMSRSGELPGLGRRLGEMSEKKHGNPLLAKRLRNGGS